MRYRTRWVAAIAVLAGLALTGCGSAGSSEEAGQEPAAVEAIDGSDVGRVTLTEEGAGRIGLTTEKVQAVAGFDSSGSARSVVPLAAVLYDKDGVSWVYTSPEPLRFIRERVVIDSVDGDSVVLRSGPAPGTLVVTVGGAELLGTEYVVEGE
jgi:hypothetical protein